MATQSQDGPKNSYRAQLAAEKLMSATRIRVHPDKEAAIRELIASIADKVPQLAKPGGIIVEEQLDPGQVLIETLPIEPEPEEVAEEPDAHCETTPDGDCVSDDPQCMHQPKEADNGTA